MHGVYIKTLWAGKQYLIYLYFIIFLAISIDPEPFMKLKQWKYLD